MDETEPEIEKTKLENVCVATKEAPLSKWLFIIYCRSISPINFDIAHSTWSTDLLIGNDY